MPNKTLIITIVNKAYVEPHRDNFPSMLDLFLESFWLGEDTRSLLDHLLLVAVDRTAYDRCKFRRLRCYRLETDGVDFTGERVYMSDDFIKMMWRRTFFLLDVLQRGYNFIFTDTDILWLRNPFPRLRTNETEDLQISNDSSDHPLAEYLINTGFYYIRSNNKTISLFEKWHSMKDNSTGMKEQDVLVRMKATGVFGQLGLSVRMLDTLYFNGFCSNRTDVGLVVTVHANCCRSVSAKVEDLAVILGGWRRFRAAASSAGGGGGENGGGNGTDGLFQWTTHVACWNAWREPNKTLL
ncbi:uncharacterized protein At1g28695-like isoform X2 [Rhododendron vialii]|nr:uncharacterized protein At1g28695-like isoform X2 [Rhododendron vialii]